jgi:hypothetical protein
MGMVAGMEFLQRPDLAPGEFKLMRSSGVESVRIPLYWSQAEPARGAYDWSTADALIGAGARRHLRLLPSVLAAPDWGAAPRD